jgi:myosin-1
MELKVTVSSQFQCMLGNKSRPLRVEVSPEAQAPNFKPGNGAAIVYAVPTSYALVSSGDRNGQQYNHKIGWKA